MAYIIELLKITLPALFVLWAAYMLMSRFFERKVPSVTDKANKALRLKAYERLTLFLERTSPDRMIQRLQNTSLNSVDFQMVLLKNIRQEYEHNLTQQLYVSDEAWRSTIQAKEAINQLINSSMQRVSPTAPSIELAKVIIQSYHSTKSTPIELSVRLLKAEVVNLLK